MEATLKSMLANTRVNWRVAIGVALIIVSGLSVVGLIRVTAATSGRWVATRLLVEGQQVQEGDIHIEQVPSSAALGEYLPGSTPVVGKVVTRVIHPGELVPLASIGEASQTLATTVVVDLGIPIASALREGAIVDLWAAPSATQSAPADAGNAAPQLLVTRARLAHRVETQPTALRSGAQVELVVSRSDVPAVIAAQARGDVLSVIASSGAAAS
jgi:hypothetical protein